MAKKPPQTRPGFSSNPAPTPRPMDMGTTPAHPLFTPRPPRQIQSFDDKHPRTTNGRFEPKARK
jgi:hypothetical protein